MPSTKGQKCNLVKIGQAVSEKKMLNDYKILYMYKAQRQGQITQEDKILIVTTATLLLLSYIVSFSQRPLIRFQKMILQHFFHTRVWECKFDLAIERSKVNLESSFESTW